VFERTSFDRRCGNGLANGGFGKEIGDSGGGGGGGSGVECYKKFRTGHSLKMRSVEERQLI